MVETRDHRVRVLYSCIICPKAFDNVQSLRAHLKVHQDVEWENFTVRLPKELCQAFREVCSNHKTTTCHVVRTLMKATITGDKTGLVDLAAANPLIVNMQEFFNARPRGHGKYDLGALEADPLTAAVRCDHLSHRDLAPGRLGWCTDIKKWVSPEICAGCVRR